MKYLWTDTDFENVINDKIIQTQNLSDICFCVNELIVNGININFMIITKAIKEMSWLLKTSYFRWLQKLMIKQIYFSTAAFFPFHHSHKREHAFIIVPDKWIFLCHFAAPGLLFLIRKLRESGMVSCFWIWLVGK